MTFQEVLVCHYILHRSLFITVFTTLYYNFYFHSYLLLWTEHSDGQNYVLFTLVSPVLAQCLAELLLFSHSVKSNSFQTHGLQHARLPCPSPVPRACSHSCSSIWWCHPTISSSVIPFSSCLQYFPASGSFLMSWLFASGGWSIGTSASRSVLPMNIQDWFPLELSGLISLQSRGLSKVFSNTTVQKHQFFSAHLFLWFNSNIHTWLLEKP